MSDILWIVIVYWSFCYCFFVHHLFFINFPESILPCKLVPLILSCSLCWNESLWCIYYFRCYLFGCFLYVCHFPSQILSSSGKVILFSIGCCTWFSTDWNKLAFVFLKKYFKWFYLNGACSWLLVRTFVFVCEEKGLHHQQQKFYSFNLKRINY